MVQAGEGLKVFCFFFSKKKALASFCHDIGRLTCF